MNPIFPDLPDYDKHPANIGMDFHFDENGISEKVLRNYLSRAQNCNCFLGDLDHTMDDLYMIFKTGAKMVSRATTPWLMGGFEYENYDEIASQNVGAALVVEGKIVQSGDFVNVDGVKYRVK